MQRTNADMDASQTHDGIVFSNINTWELGSSKQTNFKVFNWKIQESSNIQCKILHTHNLSNNAIATRFKRMKSNSSKDGCKSRSTDLLKFGLIGNDCSYDSKMVWTSRRFNFLQLHHPKCIDHSHSIHVYVGKNNAIHGWYGIDQITCSKHLHVFITVPDLWLIGFQLRSKAQAVPGKLLRGQWPGGRHREGDYSHHEMWLLFIESRGPMNELSSMSMYITYDNKYYVSLYASSGKNEEFHSEAFSFKEQPTSSMCRFKQKMTYIQILEPQNVQKKKWPWKKQCTCHKPQVMLFLWVLFCFQLPPLGTKKKQVRLISRNLSTGTFGST